MQHQRKLVRREDEKTEDYDRSVRGSIAAAPWEENAHAHKKLQIKMMLARATGAWVRNECCEEISDPPKRTITNTVKCSVPRLTAWSLRLRGASPLRKWREWVGNARGAGARSSIGWQRSVGRIERLLHREAARSVGEKRALAWRKSVASPDTRRGWVEGEAVRVCASSLKVFVHMVCGFRLADSQYDRRRSRANARSALTGWAKQKSSGS